MWCVVLFVSFADGPEKLDSIYTGFKDEKQATDWACEFKRRYGGGRITVTSSYRVNDPESFIKGK
jgi:hypothetical protein